MSLVTQTCGCGQPIEVHACPCGEHYFHHSARVFYVLGHLGPAVLDGDLVPRECRQALDKSIIGWTRGGVAVHGNPPGFQW